MTLQLRDYCPSDRDACIAIFQSNVPRYFRDHEREEFLTFLDAAESPYFVVTSGAAVLGCGGFAICPGDHRADLCWGMVDARAHRKGVGEFLLFARLHRIAENAEVQRVRLGTSQLTDGFFRRYGFSIQSQTADGIAEGLDDVEMHLELTEEIRESFHRTWRKIVSQRSVFRDA